MAFAMQITAQPVVPQGRLIVLAFVRTLRLTTITAARAGKSVQTDRPALAVRVNVLQGRLVTTITAAHAGLSVQAGRLALAVRVHVLQGRPFVAPRA